MPSMSKNGRRPPDCPDWGWVIIQEMRDFRREAAEDRKEIRQAVSEIREAVDGIHHAIKVMSENLDRFSEFLYAQHGHLIQMNNKLDTLIVGQKDQTKILHDIHRTLRVQGNGRNGRGNGSKK